jgi:hypothetical protein
MIERCEHLRFSAEARETIRIVGNGREQDFDRDVAIQLRIACAIDLAHTTGTEGGDDFVWTEASAGR